MVDKKLEALHRDMREHPEKYDFGDIPPAREIIPEVEAYMDSIAPDWVKQHNANRVLWEEARAEAEANVAQYKANFKGRWT